MKLVIALAALGLAISAGACGPSAQFHSKTGESYNRLINQAVICTEDEARTVAHTGARVIGTISGQGLPGEAEDVITDKAAKLAARHGGTHIVLTSASIETYTTTQPATIDNSCGTPAPGDDAAPCRTYTPQTFTTSQRPVAQYVVFRLAPELWANLPREMRPMRM